jgi:hypothetical protein
MTSGQDVSEYLDTLGLVKKYFSSFLRKKIKKNQGKKMSCGSDAPEDQVTCLFAGLLTHPDIPLNLIPLS